jgi:hypothetical protein
MMVEQASNQILGEDVVAQRLQSQRTWKMFSCLLSGLVLGYAVGMLYV